ncbi:hypothetical protein LS684_10230 [Cytobacillus spongiae]|uniref:hypothetical protein n=1 Tax=Cytobacillus spongiae TaxID=2901381 RepID=UPI001F3343CD|nr:hypothetical protein [Cytobacillus spongiae]UII57766.1 hypothetical protein LS684_10230 [Cytobacillus spongiae]
MKELIAFVMLVPAFIFFLIQPMLHNAEEVRGKKAQIVIQQATEKAAILGQFTPELIEEIYTEMEEVGYEKDEIELSVTTNLTYRGDYVSGKIKVPNDYFFVLAKSLLLLNDDSEMYHVRSATRMSEFIN